MVAAMIASVGFFLFPNPMTASIADVVWTVVIVIWALVVTVVLALWVVRKLNPRPAADPAVDEAYLEPGGMPEPEAANPMAWRTAERGMGKR